MPDQRKQFADALIATVVISFSARPRWRRRSAPSRTWAAGGRELVGAAPLRPYLHGTRRARHAILLLALQTGLTTYDAAYLYLARSLGIPLVTFDEQLQTAL